MTEDTIKIDVKAEKNYTILLVNRVNIASVENGRFEFLGNDTRIKPLGSGRIVCKLNNNLL